MTDDDRTLAKWIVYLSGPPILGDASFVKVRARTKSEARGRAKDAFGEMLRPHRGRARRLPVGMRIVRYP